mgnify:CR=1 FL=1
MKKLCKCGCKKEVTNILNEFIHGHNRRNTVMNENTKKALLLSSIGRVKTKEELDKISKTVSSIWKEENSPYRRKEVLERKGSSLKDAWKNPVSKWFTEECKKIQRDKNLENRRSSNNPYDEEFNLKLSRIHREIWKDPNSSYNSKSRSKKISVRMKELYKDEEYLKKLQKGLKIFPNRPETLILSILNKIYPNEWKYTGDYSFWINGRNPDFTCINGKKLLIEHFGTYWHDGDDPEEHKKIFAEFGYRTLVIWENELKNIEEVKNKIKRFVGEIE